VNCAMCPAWMGSGMVLGLVIGVLVIVLLVVVILKSSGLSNMIDDSAAGLTRPQPFGVSEHGYTGNARK
jgi:hypothetical protein